MSDITLLHQQLLNHFETWIENSKIQHNEITLQVKPEQLYALCLALRDEQPFEFKLLVDVCGVDYLHYGLDSWQTESSTETGFGRGVTDRFLQESDALIPAQRFAVVYHLLSISKNQRLRLKVFIPDAAQLIIDSVTPIWPAANWFERETFDLFGILFKGHPDLRRILTDYGFVGHPFRKDFPLIGKVEARYDANLKRVIYEPVSIEPRILEPKVIRHDNRYINDAGEPPHGR